MSSKSFDTAASEPFDTAACCMLPCRRPGDMYNKCSAGSNAKAGEEVEPIFIVDAKVVEEVKPIFILVVAQAMAKLLFLENQRGTNDEKKNAGFKSKKTLLGLGGRFYKFWTIK
jgi:hypothetical protein